MTDSCDAIWELLSLYADGMAGIDDSVAVERHVGSCDSCARDLAFMRSTSSLIATAPAVEPPSSLRQSIIAATVDRRTWIDRARDAFRTPAFRFSGIALAGAAAAAVALTVLTPSVPKPVSQPIQNDVVAKRPPIDFQPTNPNTTIKAPIRRTPATDMVAEHRDRSADRPAVREAVLQPAERIEKALFTTDSVNRRKPPAPGSSRVIAKLNRSKNEPKGTATGGPMDVTPPMEALTSPAPPMTMPEGMKSATNLVDPGLPTIKPTAPSGGKITMSANSGMSATAAASLAGLRGSLLNQKRDSERSISSAVYRPNETNQVTLDLIKSKF